MALECLEHNAYVPAGLLPVFKVLCVYRPIYNSRVIINRLFWQFSIVVKKLTLLTICNTLRKRENL